MLATQKSDFKIFKQTTVRQMSLLVINFGQINYAGRYGLEFGWTFYLIRRFALKYEIIVTVQLNLTQLIG